MKPKKVASAVGIAVIIVLATIDPKKTGALATSLFSHPWLTGMVLVGVVIIWLLPKSPFLGGLATAVAYIAFWVTAILAVIVGLFFLLTKIPFISDGVAWLIGMALVGVVLAMRPRRRR